MSDLMALEDLSNIDPQRDHGDLRTLKTSIQKIGLLEPLVVETNGRLVAGRRRYQALKELGWTEAPVRIVTPANDYERFLMALHENTCRLQMSWQEEAACALTEKRLYEAQFPETKHGAVGGGHPKARVAECATLFECPDCHDPRSWWSPADEPPDPDHEYHQCSACGYVRRVESAQRYTTVKAGLEHVSERTVRAQVELGEALEAHPELRDCSNAYVARRKMQELARPDPPQARGTFDPLKTYDCILADPPWPYETQIESWGPTGLHYETRSTQDIAALRETLGLQVADDAVLFLWAVNPLIRLALDVAEGWGFIYKTNIVWVKTELKRPGSGYYVRGRHELLFICTRGHMLPPVDLAPPVGSVLEAPVREHSRKPDEAYAIIERLYPKAVRLELYARHERAGWDGWGDEYPVS